MNEEELVDDEIKSTISETKGDNVVKGDFNTNDDSYYTVHGTTVKNKDSSEAMYLI